jgi:hypothetical protein
VAVVTRVLLDVLPRDASAPCTASRARVTKLNVLYASGSLGNIAVYSSRNFREGIILGIID